MPASEETVAALKDDDVRVVQHGRWFTSNIMLYYRKLLERDVPQPAANGRTVFILHPMAYLDAMKPHVTKSIYQ